VTHDEKNLQDYLDGRLPDGERARFEARMREDPELAKRVDAARDIRDALREEPEELSPGFYARARERFEQSAGGRQRSGWRLLSWESAGLAAATVLALALFVPGVLRDSRSNLEPTITEPAAEGFYEDVGEQSSTEAADELRVREKAAADKDDAELESPGKMKNTAVEAPGPPMSAPAPRQEAPAGRQDVPVPSGEKQEAIPPTEQEYAPVPDAAPLPPGSGERVDETSKKGRRAEPKRRVQSVTAEGHETDRAGEAWESEELNKSGALAYSIRSPRVVELARELVGSDELLVVDDLSEWTTWLEGPAGNALAALDAPDPARRLVLIAPEGGIDCGTITLIRDDDRHVVRYRAATTPGAPSGGCAFVLPNDGKAVHGERHD
jgi:hypothetical protein